MPALPRQLNASGFTGDVPNSNSTGYDFTILTQDEDTRTVTPEAQPAQGLHVLGLSEEESIILVVILGFLTTLCICLFFRWLDTDKGVFDPQRRDSKKGESSLMGRIKRFLPGEDDE